MGRSPGPRIVPDRHCIRRRTCKRVCGTGKIPVGPICNPSIESIEASIEPEKHNYYYFVADCKGQVYLSKNSTEHYNIINKLKKENNWCV